MLRSIFIYLSKAAWARNIVTGWAIVWRMASRFIAGETLDDAITIIKQLNSKGIYATLDHLGEHTLSVKASFNATQEIVNALDAIVVSGLKANVSIKLSQIGLNLDQGLCTENLRKILTHARGSNNFIRVDMEDSSATQNTIDLVFQMKKEGFNNIGTVIQSYLYRSDSDIADLTRNHIPVRLCKGAYKEPPDLVYPQKKDVDEAFDRLGMALMEATVSHQASIPFDRGKFPPLTALATHDEIRIALAKQFAESIKLEKDCLEFQMLHGIRRDLQDSLSHEGYPVRVYVPYGTEWYPYFMRRLAERPANVWFLLSNFFRK